MNDAATVSDEERKALDCEPLVSMVIPAREETGNIARCLDAVLAQDWPRSSLEVIVVDGSSRDGTAEGAERHLEDRGLARAVVLDNPVASTPSNLNQGLADARGEYVCRVDARSLIPPGYVRRCVAVLESRPEVSVVGGRQVAVPPNETATGRGIARALNNRYTMGLSRYRRGASSGPSDTVYLGFFRTSDLRSVGGWDERLGTNQDFDLNRRLSKRGTVWFEASLEVGYIPRATFGELFRQYHRFGRAKVAYWRMTGDKPRPRQLVGIALPPAAVAIGVGLIAAVPRRVRGRTVIGGLLVLGSMMLTIEHGGSRASTDPATRVTALVGSTVVTSAWTLGVWSGLIGPRGASFGRSMRRSGSS